MDAIDGPVTRREAISSARVEEAGDKGPAQSEEGKALHAAGIRHLGLSSRGEPREETASCRAGRPRRQNQGHEAGLVGAQTTRSRHVDRAQGCAETEVGGGTDQATLLEGRQATTLVMVEDRGRIMPLSLKCYPEVARVAMQCSWGMSRISLAGKQVWNPGPSIYS